MNGWPRSARYASWCAVVIAVLLLAAEFVAPRFIAAAYRGESIDALNGILAGRDQHPLDYYLAVWHRLSRLAVAGIAVFFGFAALWRWKLAALVRPILRSQPDLQPRQVLWVAAWFGALAGLGEAALRLARYLIERHPARQFAWEAIWMAPLASIIAFMIIATLMLGVAMAVGAEKRRIPPVAIRSAVFVFAGLAGYAVLIRPETHLASYAAAILSLGLASWLTRWSERNEAGLMRIIRTSSIPIAAFLLFSTGIGIWMLPTPLERRRLAGLPPAPDRPNVLLIILDTVRASSLSLYGYERETTPNMDRFAGRGVVFDRAIATAPWTLPSHASIFTGRYPHEMSADIGVPLDRTHPVLAEVLVAEGYATAAFVANYAYTTEASGLARGFARYEDYPIHAGRFFRSSWLAERLIADLADLDNPRGRKMAETVTDDFLRWSTAHTERPFFAFLNYMDAHYPYSSAPPFDTMFSRPGQPSKYTPKREGITLREMDGVRSAYDNAIAYTDAEVGRLLDELGRLGILDNTVVVITADHGEHLGEHGLQDHTNSLYMPLLHVPLLVAYPPRVPRGTRVADPVSIRDIPTTVLDLVGLTSRDQLAGSSLAGRWTSDIPVGTNVDAVLSELNHWLSEDLLRPWDPVYLGSMKSLVRGDLHYIRDGRQKEEVYNLALDPDELSDLSATLDPQTVLDLRSAVDSISGSEN